MLRGFACTATAIVKDIAEEMRQRPDRGDVATYIPELANVDSQRFGIAIVDAQGRVATGGDADMPFSIQSISKEFTAAEKKLLTQGEAIYKELCFACHGLDGKGMPVDGKPAEALVKRTHSPFFVVFAFCFIFAFVS